MILYHCTTRDRAERILKEGLKIPKGNIYIYLSPKPNQWVGMDDGNGHPCDTVLEVETGDAELRCFDDCKAWEVLSMNEIPANRIRDLPIPLEAGGRRER